MRYMSFGLLHGGGVALELGKGIGIYRSYSRLLQRSDDFENRYLFTLHFLYLVGTFNYLSFNYTFNPWNSPHVPLFVAHLPSFTFSASLFCPFRCISFSHMNRHISPSTLSTPFIQSQQQISLHIFVAYLILFTF